MTHHSHKTHQDSPKDLLQRAILHVLAFKTASSNGRRLFLLSPKNSCGGAVLPRLPPTSLALCTLSVCLTVRCTAWARQGTDSVQKVFLKIPRMVYCLSPLYSLHTLRRNISDNPWIWNLGFF